LLRTRIAAPDTDTLLAPTIAAAVELVHDGSVLAACEGAIGTPLQ
jgi:hypothetical protein